MPRPTTSTRKKVAPLASRKADDEPKETQISPHSRALPPWGWDTEEPTFDLRGLRADVATAMMMQHVLGRHFWGRITLRGYSSTAFAKKMGVIPSDLWYFFNGHRFVRFATIAALYANLPEEDWPDMVVVEAKTGIIRNRSEQWMAERMK